MGSTYAAIGPQPQAGSATRCSGSAPNNTVSVLRGETHANSPRVIFFVYLLTYSVSY